MAGHGTKQRRTERARGSQVVHASIKSSRVSNWETTFIQRARRQNTSHVSSINILVSQFIATYIHCPTPKKTTTKKKKDEAARKERKVCWTNRISNHARVWNGRYVNKDFPGAAFVGVGWKAVKWVTIHNVVCLAYVEEHGRKRRHVTIHVCTCKSA